ncbi:MAG: aminotransferase class I/II-fold pyridoxal phosphate-dependent enzyme [Clostridia bacterium]|nr:aminotransferase class I/II-fold pyridoxal phosphate-dependent enzyme [Clostridia bacterium]
MINYDNVLSTRAAGIKPSGIRKFFDLLDGRDDVISLTVGQPDFVTPWHIREKAIRSIEDGKTYYTANSGLPELRRAIADYLNRRFSLSYDSKNEIIVTVGGSEAIDMAMRAIIDPGDEVIIPMPSYVCYEPMTQLLGAVPVTINTKSENAFKLTAQELKKAITPRTKALILPFPNNPTGAVLDAEDVKEIAEVLKDTDIAVISDEIYAELTYGRRHVSIASVPGMRERTVLVSGVSKAYAMTGWRLGYIAAPKEITRQILKIHQYAIMCAPTASQFAAVEAFDNSDEDIEYMRAQYNRRRTMLLEGLETIGLPCFEPRGAFYVFPQVTQDCKMTSEEFCNRLLNENSLAIVPGTAFGECGEGFARLSYAYSVKHIAGALERLEDFVKKIKK